LAPVANDRRQRISPGDAAGKDGPLPPKSIFTNAFHNDAGDQGIELQIKAGEAPKVSDGKDDGACFSAQKP